MFPPVDTMIVAKAAAAGFVLAVVWFGSVDRWWKGSERLSMAVLLPLRIVAAAAASVVTSFFLYQFLLEVVGAEDPKAGIVVASMLWAGFIMPVAVLDGVSEPRPWISLLADLVGALLFVVVIGGTLGLFAGPYR